MPEREHRIRRIPIPKTDDPEELKRIARTQAFATDSRTLVIQPALRGAKPFRWRSDVLREYVDHPIKREKIVGLIASQLQTRRRAFVVAATSF